MGALLEEKNVWGFRYDGALGEQARCLPFGAQFAPGIASILDGSSTRPVHWYFDNLLSEERSREVVAKDAGIRSPGDSFSLLEYLGKESARSSTLLRVDEELEQLGDLRALPDEEPEVADYPPRSRTSM